MSRAERTCCRGRSNKRASGRGAPSTRYMWRGSGAMYLSSTGVGTASATFVQPQCLGTTIVAKPAIEPGECLEITKLST
ncbi:hypothetical protein Zm00014a_004598 [Zea mays]|uniref:Uncharacterized protein n=2 Tax=Zea mays TaxID=4577 RepID=A0A979HL88_MAIZE|nr:hypothetical protein ZEAMMB73_Zm00001d024553 [Zea mays]AQK41473.1 hypothetical protein ZEAMMB73_Zm00001d024553 [Zea mays]PWZ46521.1 hypothetical protein Zm00014a_004598 [Zea mays]PWZ46522.1 hypothetical protein Zm00014a_004598 [Zea mays]